MSGLKARAMRVLKAEKKLGRREGHYLLGRQFVRIWVVFYPSEAWWICDAHHLTGDIEGTARKLDAETEKKLENWL